jgi:hypothetical protein
VTSQETREVWGTRKAFITSFLAHHVLAPKVKGGKELSKAGVDRKGLRLPPLKLGL